jgi:hypothetical protein
MDIVLSLLPELLKRLLSILGRCSAALHPRLMFLRRFQRKKAKGIRRPVANPIITSMPARTPALPAEFQF